MQGTFFCPRGSFLAHWMSAKLFVALFKQSEWLKNGFRSIYLSHTAFCQELDETPPLQKPRLMAQGFNTSRRYGWLEKPVHGGLDGAIVSLVWRSKEGCRDHFSDQSVIFVRIGCQRVVFVWPLLSRLGNTTMDFVGYVVGKLLCCKNWKKRHYLQTSGLLSQGFKGSRGYFLLE